MLRTPGSWQLLIFWVPVIMSNKVINRRLQGDNFRDPKNECFVWGSGLLFIGTGIFTLIGGLLRLSVKDITFWVMFSLLTIGSLILAIAAQSNDSSDSSSQ
ncbi:hypothetical protein [Argonema antarcticum]|uniref:hypothetical protein n=1 Tax=Argonema antarcticum TaxID=2942763 RepID=UPI0020114CC7|nr:hypothetical protein [Argonema antarcticum]MCL1475339.1 hypothetical protein [Argonema antarcticum A004/B2]